MGEGRHRWEFMIKPGETAVQVLHDAFIETLLAPWDVQGAITIERKAVYRFNARVARDWRKNKVILAGDAAHQTPPFAGQGLCAGARDAANLGWKLAAVITGRASDAVLDTYQSEREPHARATIEMAMMMGRTVCITDPVAAAGRDHQMLAARAAGEAPDGAFNYPDINAGLVLTGSPGAGSYFPQFVNGTDRFDENMDPGAWLIVRSMKPKDNGLDLPGISTVATSDPKLRSLSDAMAAWFDEHDADAVLIRPDRYVFGTGSADQLLAAWHAQLGTIDEKPNGTGIGQKGKSNLWKRILSLR